MLMIVATATLVGSIVASTNVLSTNPTAVLTVEDKKSNSSVSIILPEFLTDTQARNITIAHDIGKRDGLQPGLLPAIIMKETQAGEYPSYKVAGQEFGLTTNQRYYGLAQIKLSAAKDVLKAYPNLTKEFRFHTKTDEEIIAKLIENDVFNMSVASKYLLLLRKSGYDTVRQLALAYNQGPGGAKAHDPQTHQYSQGVMRNIQKLKLES